MNYSEEELKYLAQELFEKSIFYGSGGLMISCCYVSDFSDLLNIKSEFRKSNNFKKLSVLNCIPLNLNSLKIKAIKELKCLFEDLGYIVDDTPIKQKFKLL